MLPVLVSASVSTEQKSARARKRRTVSDALEIVVCLGGSEVDADPLVVDFVLDVAKENKGRDDTLADARLDPGLDGAVPHVRRRGQHGADGARRHGQQHVLVVDLGLALADPVHVLGIAEVVLVVAVAVERVHAERLVDAHGRGHARVDAEGHARIAAAEAEGADAALVVL